MKIFKFLLIALVAIGLFNLFLGGDGNGPDGPDPNALQILAGSELKELEPFIEDIERATGIRLQFHFTGTLDGAETLAAGGEYHLGWFSHAKYLNLLQDKTGNRIIKASERLMTSPVILGVKRSVGERLGWCDTEVSWRQIAERAAAGEFRFAMTNPAASNSGFSSVVAAQVAFSGEALSVDNVDPEEMRQLAQGHRLRAGSSGWLADLYLRRQAEVDGIFNYESVLFSLNANPQLQEQFCLVYPSEGIVTADYPLLLLDESRRADYDKLLAYFKDSAFQQRLMGLGWRPVNASVRLDARFPDRLILEAPFPASVEVVDAILMAYLERQLQRGHAIYIIDTSGSMAGNGIEQLRQTLRGLTGEDRSITGQFARYRDGERISFLPFNHKPLPLQTWTFTQDPALLAQIKTAIDGLQADGGTAIFDALQQAYRQARKERQERGSDYPISLVLMSDGRSGTGLDEQGFANWLQQQPSGDIPVFSVVFGSADKTQMQRIAEITGGRSFDSRQHSLSHVFKTIRGYQ